MTEELEVGSIVQIGRFTFGRIVAIVEPPRLRRLYEVRFLQPAQVYGKIVRFRKDQVKPAPLLYQLAGALGDDE